MELKIIGITGPSGSGKDKICSILENRNCFIIDADKVAHQLMEPQAPAYNAILDFFGKRVLNDKFKIDRKILANIVFSNEYYLKKLNFITHKHIRSEIIKIIDEVQENPKNFRFIFLNAPLLIEAKLNEICDKIWVVNSDIRVRLKRVIKRDNITPDEVFKRFNNQKTFKELKMYADVIIENDVDDPRTLENKVLKQLDLLKLEFINNEG